MADRSKPLRARWAARRVPEDVGAVVAAAVGERLLTWGRDRSGDPLVATDAGLWAYGERLAWLEIDHVGWADRVLSIRAVDGEVRQVPVGDDRDLPAVIKAQVEASVLASTVVPLLASGRGATIVARRAGRSQVEWRVLYDAGVRQDDPAVQSQIDAALAAFRAELGI